MEQPQRGRPPLPPDEVRSTNLTMRLTTNQRAALDAAATARNMDVTVLVRELAFAGLATASNQPRARAAKPAAKSRRRAEVEMSI